jgi:hypothetical protein
VAVRKYFSILAAMFCSGCSITPSQEEVTGVKTSVIARRLACEVRASAYELMGIYLATREDDPEAVRSGLAIKQDIEAYGSDDIRRIDFKGVKPHNISKINKYLDTAVAFDFTLDGLETNNTGISFTPFRAFQRGSRSFETSLNLDRSRQNTQNFTDSYTLRELLFRKDPRWCNVSSEGPNYLYPIAGKVGIFDKLYQFVELSEFTNLGPAKGDKNGVPAMSFNMKFTTKVSGTLAPKITLAPVVGVTRTSTSFNLDAERTDTHTLILAFARGDLIVQDSTFFSALSSQFVAPVPDRAQQQARNEISRNILRSQINNPYRPTVIYQSLVPFL